MFDNVVDSIETDGQIVISHHLIGNWDHMLPDYTHIHMLFFGLIVSTVAIIAISIYQYIRWEFYDKKQTVRVLPNYTNSLNLTYCEDLFKEEKMIRRRGGYSQLTDLAFEKIKARISNHEFGFYSDHSCHLDQVYDDSDNSMGSMVSQ